MRTSFYVLFDPAEVSATGYHTAAAAPLSVVDPTGEKPEIGQQRRQQVSKNFAGGDAMTYADTRVLLTVARLTHPGTAGTGPRSPGGVPA